VKIPGPWALARSQHALCDTFAELQPTFASILSFKKKKKKRKNYVGSEITPYIKIKEKETDWPKEP